jgi:hypothetical protein
MRCPTLGAPRGEVPVDESNRAAGAIDRVVRSHIVVADDRTSVGRPDLQARAIRMARGEADRQVMESAQQPRGTGERRGGVHPGRRPVGGDLALDEAEHFPALLIGAQEAGCAVEAGVGQMPQQLVDPRTPRAGRTSHRGAHPDDGRDRATGQSLLTVRRLHPESVALRNGRRSLIRHRRRSVSVHRGPTISATG